MYPSRGFLSITASAIIGVILSCSVAGAASVPPPPTTIQADCQLVGNLTTGVVLLRKMMTKYYNARLTLEGKIAPNLFMDSNAVGMLELYSRVILALQNPSAQYRFPTLFATMMRKVTTQACQWLLSYGDVFTLFDIDCTDSSDLILLASFLRLRPMLDSTFQFLQQFECPTHGSDEHQWLTEHVSSFPQELTELNMLPANLQVN